jgi:hypothetical protein
MAYKTDLNDTEWDLIKKDFEPASNRGNGHKHSKKSIVNAILYIVNKCHEDGLIEQLINGLVRKNIDK